MNLEAERAYPTPLSNSSLLPLLLLSLSTQRHAPESTTTIESEYDYIVVGSGSAGAVIASRLSELRCATVLLLEAGKRPPLLTEVPALDSYMLNTDIDWQFNTSKQEHVGRGLENGQLSFHAGKVVGGSSIINSMLYVRGHPQDYDDWEDNGAEGWSYDDVLPYFKKSEDNRDPDYVANGFHGVGGLQTVERPAYLPEFTGAIFEAGKLMGYEVVDPNSDQQIGFYDIQATIRGGQRCSTAKAFLVPAEKRRNLHILANAMATKVIIENHQAKGVEFDFGGSKLRVKVRKEVIISAGVINSPKLLMLSGIGPGEELEKFDIPVAKDLPVGRNLHNHPGANVDFVYKPRIPKKQKKLSNTRNIEEYIQSRKGPLSSLKNVATLAFFGGESEDDRPTYQLSFHEGSAESYKRVGLKPEVYQQVYAPYENASLITCQAEAVKPKSRGFVTLQSKDPYAPPIINPNILEDSSDLETLVEAMKMCKKVATSKPLRELGSRPLATLFPGCEDSAGDDDLYFECQARSVGKAVHHAGGTAKMGDPSDETSVVDSHLRVIGIKGLRVADASIMPTVPTANTAATVIMIGEKAADLIKSDADCSGGPPA